MRMKISTAALLTILFVCSAASAKSVYVITIDGVIDPAVENYVKTSVETAEAENAEALVIELDTPGGLLSSTKNIVQIFLDAEVPVVVYVAPAGASATSAGMMVTIAAHVAVMAPGTNIGAAHPVMISNEGQYQSIPKDDVMMEKATNDTVGWVRSICELRGRNAEWAEKAVTESASVSALEALDQKVIDGMAKDREELVEKFLDNRKVKLKSGDSVTMQTKDSKVIELSMTVPQKLHHVLNNPNLIYVLMLLGFLGIAIEFKSPGLIFPAAIGVSCILVALLAPTLSISYTGLLLIILAFGFFIAEIFITSFGLLTVAGVVALVFGSLMLFDVPEVPTMDQLWVQDLSPSWSIIIALVTFVTSVILLFGGAILRAHRQKVMTGREEMIGEQASAETDIGPGGGKIFVHGEYWNAVSDAPVAKGDKVVIKSVDRLVCKVEKPAGSGEAGPESA